MIRVTAEDGTQGIARQRCCDDPTPGYHVGEVYCEACDTTLFRIVVEPAPEVEPWSPWEGFADRVPR